MYLHDLALNQRNIFKKTKINTLGCDTGFGFQLAKKLHNDGFKVFAGCLFAEKEGATELRQYGIDVIQLNVTEEKEWDACVDHIQSSKVKLWGLVHNAGWSTFGEVEWIPMKTYRRIADINVFGLMMGTQKMLPLIRPNKGMMKVSVNDKIYVFTLTLIAFKILIFKLHSIVIAMMHSNLLFTVSP